MANVPSHLLYTEEHEYVHKSDVDDVVEIGITDYAQGELGDVVYVDLPAAGSKFRKMEVFGTIEAVKAVSELYCPVAGEVVEKNPALESDPSLVNKDPYGAGWMIRLKVKNPGELGELLSPDDYTSHIGH
ncbi:MAG: glycine cleavage system protein H [Gemmatimonadetes bacterium GWC2_71_10]|nr:MAG: glycine cleavage system protein H [Gemmatimonadetes bacterium GWC2_71_10]